MEIRFWAPEGSYQKYHLLCCRKLAQFLSCGLDLEMEVMQLLLTLLWFQSDM